MNLERRDLTVSRQCSYHFSRQTFRTHTQKQLKHWKKWSRGMFSSLFWHHINYTEQSNSRFAGLRFIFSTQLQCVPSCILKMVWWSHPSPKRTIFSSLHWSVTKSDERVPNMDWHTDTGFFPFFSLKSSFDNFLWRFHGLTCKKCIFQRGTSWKMKPSLYPWNQGQMATSSQNQAEWRTVWRAGNLL